VCDARSADRYREMHDRVQSVGTIERPSSLLTVGRSGPASQQASRLLYPCVRGTGTGLSGQCQDQDEASVHLGQKAVDHCVASTMKERFVVGKRGKRRVKGKNSISMVIRAFVLQEQSPCFAGSSRGERFRCGLD
jgi:hypothetical protein